MFTYKIYDDHGRNLIFATQSFTKFMVEYHRLESIGVTINEHGGIIRANVKVS
jgi:hypothetical protein